MEPPAKRMRILQSIGIDEVDESNPEYIKGKKQNSEWLKNKWDAIYAKYEAMSDMMSDEVDMRGNGSIVLDRGHMRKLDREYRSRLGRRTVMPTDDTQLVDDMFANDTEMGMDDDEDSEHDERDELAPSQSPEPVLRESNPISDGSVSNQHTSSIASPSRPAGIQVLSTPSNAALQATLAASTNPAADLIQLVQFPQTPAGQQARRAFEAQTAQAVQQAVASIFSSLLSNVPSLQRPQLDLLQTPVTPAVDTNVIAPVIAPATAPSLCRSPPPAASDSVAPVQSSPVPVSRSEPRKRRSFAKGVYIKPSRHNTSRKDVPLFLEDATTEIAEEQASKHPINENKLNVDQSAVEVPLESPQNPRKRRKRFFFTAKDDQYIIESRILHHRTWDEIKSGRAKWRNWGNYILEDHWRFKLSERAARLETSGAVGLPRARSAAEAGRKETTSLSKRQEAQPLSSPTAAQHLPTPSSIEHENEESAPENPEDIITSGGHFDDDERDLLSLYEGSGRLCDVQMPPLDDDSDGDLDDSREIPETPMNLTQEDATGTILQGIMTQEGTLELNAVGRDAGAVNVASNLRGAESSLKETSTRESLLIDPISVSTAITEANSNTTNRRTPSAKKPATVPTSSSNKPASRSKSILNYQVESDSDADLDLVDSHSFLSESHQCTLCKQTFPTVAILRAHETQPHPKEIHVRASPAVPLLHENDELNAPSTPPIKREPLDPPQNFLLSTPAFKTPVSTPPQQQRTAVHSSGGDTKSTGTGKLSRSAYNRVKRSWARKATDPAPRRRQSLKGVPVPRKRFWGEFDDGSEDELAM